MPSTEAKKQTHAELCSLAVKWLKRSPSAGGPGCQLAISECRSGWNGEIPDAIGFLAGFIDCISVVVEAKTSRSDFLADRKKPHRAPGQGIGAYRYMMCPEGMIGVDELPEGWGLLWVNSRGHIKPKAGPASEAKGRYDDYQASLVTWRQPCDLLREQWLLVKLLAQVGDPEKVKSCLREAYGAKDRLTAQVNDQAEQLKSLRRENNRMRWQLKDREAIAAQ